MALMLSVVLASSSINALAFNSDGATSVDSVTQGQGNANPAGASGGETKVGYDFNVKFFLLIHHSALILVPTSLPFKK